MPNTETVSNIVRGVTDKATGNPGKNGGSPEIPANGGGQTAATPDPNAGKEKYVIQDERGIQQERWLTPQQAREYVQKGISFEPRIDQLGRLQQETAAFLDTLANDPAKVIYNERFGKPHEVLKKLLGSTKVTDELKESLGQWYYDNVIVPEKMTPEQREAEEWKRKAFAHDELLKQQEQSRIESDNNARVDQALQIIKAQINEAMKEAGVPLDSKIAPQLAQRCAQVMQLGYRRGIVVTPKEAIAKVKAELSEYQKSYYDVLDEDKLVEQLGKENAEKVRKFYLKTVKDADKDKLKKDYKPSAKRNEREVMTPDQFREYLQDLKAGK